MFASQILDSQIGGNLLEVIENPLYLAVAHFILLKGLFEMGYRPPRYTVGTLLTIIILLVGMGVIRVTAQIELIHIVTAQQSANVRATPSTSSAVVGSLSTGQTAEIIEENSNGENIGGNSLWYRVRLSDNVEGWVWSGVVTISEVIPTPTITPYPTLSPNPDYETITVENADQLRLAYSWGQGMLLKVAWSSDGKQIVAATTNGLWIYDADNLQAGARQIYRFPDQSQGRYVGEIGFIGNTTNVYLLTSTGISRDGLVFEVVNLANGQQGAVVGLTAAVPGGITVGHTSQRVAVSPDGLLIAAPDANGVRFLGLVYDSPTETITRIHERGLLDVGGEPQALTFNPDGSRLAVSADDRIQIYDLADQNLIINVEGSAPRLLFSPDGTSLILMDTSIRLDASTGIVLQRYEHHGYSSASYDAVMRPDGTRLAVNYGFGIRFYDTTLSTEISSFPGSNYYTSLAYSPDGRQLAGVGPNAGDLTIWDADTGGIIYRDSHYIVRWPELAFAENGTMLVEWGDGGRLRMSPVRSPDMAFRDLPRFGQVSLRSNRLLGNSTDEYGNQVLQVFTRDGMPVSEPLVLTGRAAGSAISPDGQTALISRSDGGISIRDGSMLALQTTVFQDCCAIYHFAFSDDGHYFVSSGDESAVYIWTVDGQLVQRFAIPQNSGGVGAVINADGSRIAATVDSGVYVWDVPTGSRLGPYVPFRPRFVALSPDGTLLAVYTGYGIITLYDVQSVAPIGEIRTGGGSGNLTFTPDGSLLVTSGIDDGVIRFWGVRRAVTTQPTNTSTPTLNPSPTKTPTATLSPTSSTTTTPTSTLSPTPAAQTELIRIVTAQQNANIRAMPSTSSGIVGSLATGQTAEVLEENPNGESVSGNALWYRVRLPDNAEGWVWSDVVIIAEVTATPSPTPRPTLSPNPDYETITVENAQNVRPVYQWGRGIPSWVAWSSDGDRLLVASTRGLWIYNTQDFSAGADLAFPINGDDSLPPQFAQAGFIGNTSNVYYLTYLYRERASVLQVVNLSNHEQGATIRLNQNLDFGELRNGANFQPIALSPDGHTFAIADPQGVRFIELQYDSSDMTITEVEEHDLLSLSFQPSNLAFSPDGTRLVMSDGETTRLYEYPSNNLIASITMGGSIIVNSNNSTFALLGAFQFFNTFTFFDLVDGSQRQTIRIPFGVTDAKLNPSSNRLAVSYRLLPRGIRFFNSEDGQELPLLSEEINYSQLVYSPDATYLAAVSMQTGVLGVWDTISQQAVFSDRYSPQIRTIQMDASGNTLAVQGGSSLVTFYDPRDDNGTPRTTLNLPQWHLFDTVVLDPTNERLFVVGSVAAGAGWETAMQMIDVQGNPLSEEMRFATSVSGGIARSLYTAFAFSPDGQILAIGQYNGRITLRDATTLQPLASVFQDCCEVRFIRFSEDERYIISGGGSHNIWVWTIAGNPVTSLSLPRLSGQNVGMLDLTISENGERIAAAYGHGASVWNIATGEMLWQYNEPGVYVYNTALSPDGQLLALYQSDLNQTPQISLYDLNTGDILRRLPWRLSSFTLHNLQFTSDGSLLIGASEDGLIRFWGVRREVELQPTSTLTPPPIPTVTPSPTLTPSLTDTLTPTTTPSPTLTPTPTPVTLFQDNFETGDLSQWDNSSSIGSITTDGGNHILRLENTSNAFLIFPLQGQGWSDYAVEARVRIQQGTVFLNVRENVNGQYAAILDAATSSGGLSAGANGNFYDLGGQVIGFPMNRWLQLRIEVAGDQIELYVNGVLIQSATSDYHIEGGISFTLAPQTVVEIDDVRVLGVT